MGMMKAVDKVKTELQLTRSISKQRAFRMDQRKWGGLHAFPKEHFLLGSLVLPIVAPLLVLHPA